MTPELRDFRLRPSARAAWRRAADELLISAIFGEGRAAGVTPNASQAAEFDKRALLTASPLLRTAESIAA